MTVIGFHASHEQVRPAELLRAVVAAEQAGFAAAMCSDHFSPWSARQGHRVRVVLAGCRPCLDAAPVRVVNAPGQRYHPALIAQAAATLASMFPDRFWVALGTGEASNEHITGDGWPRKDVRTARLRECVDVLRALLDGEEVSHDGLVTVDRARIWTLPDEPPMLLGAAVSVGTARTVAEWADGLITVGQPHDHLQRMIEAYRDAGGRGRLVLQVHLSWAPDEDKALEIAHEQWRTNVFPPPVCWDLDTVELFDAVSEHVPPEAIRRHVQVSSDLGRHAAWLHELATIGFDELYLHHVGRDQAEFIDAFGGHVLPQLEETG